MAKWKVPAADDGRGLKEDATIQLLVPDPGDVPEVLVLKGLMGQSPTKDVWRIYVTNDLSEYFEVRAEDVVLAEHGPGVTRAWVTRKPIRHVKMKTWSAEIEYLAGAIASETRGAPVVGLAGPDEGFGPEPTKCINHCNTTTR